MDGGKIPPKQRTTKDPIRERQKQDIARARESVRQHKLSEKRSETMEVQNGEVTSTNEMEDRTHELSEMEAYRGDMKGSKGAVKLSLYRPPGFANMDLIFNARMFLTMYVFDPICGISSHSGHKAGIVVFPLYCFNTGNAGIYFDSVARDKIHALTASDVNIRVQNISGSLKSIGVSAPFIAGGTNQAATNSQITATGLVGHGLERMTEMVEGRINISNDTPTATGFTSNVTTSSWWANTRHRFTNITENAVIRMTSEQMNPTAQFVEYRNVAGQILNFRDAEPSPPAPAPVQNQLVVDSNYTKQMTSIDLTESQGEILAWNYDMNDSFLALKSLRPQFDVPQSFNTAPDFKYSFPSSGNAVVVTNPLMPYSYQYPGYLSEGNIQNFWITNNNADPVGAAGARHQTLPPKAYLQLVPPPTINPTAIQDFFVNTVLDTTIVIDAFGSSVAANGFTHDYSYIPKETFRGFRQSFLDGGKFVAVQGELVDIGV
uniref:Capsid protein n=1 Tax=Cygnus columbianus parvoviridae sp. TaxID=2794474 RepID=A0A8A4XC27_9VIRU|nr:MAG: hypothetical protein [Cygnus columbianus parvoviridae sp.]